MPLYLVLLIMGQRKEDCRCNNFKPTIFLSHTEQF